MALDLTDLAMLQLGQQAQIYDLTSFINRRDSSKRVEEFYHRMHRHIPLTHTLEIGAHEATYSKTVKKNHSHLICRAFEANTLVYSHFLLNNILETGVEYNNMAIGDYDGTAKFYIYTKINDIKEDSDSRRQSLLKRVDTPPEKSELSAVYVPITRLDNITKNDPKNSLYSMWIDAEGATSMILAGGTETLKNVAMVYVEAESVPIFEGQIKDKELMQFFMERDYMPILRDFQFLNQYNIVFVRKDFYTKIEHDLHNYLGYHNRLVLSKFYNIQGDSGEHLSITPPPLPKIEFKNVEELQKAIDALPIIRPTVDGLDPNKTVVACHAEHLEEAIEFYKKNLKSLPSFYVLGDYSNMKVDKNISLNDFAKLDNTFSVQVFTSQGLRPGAVHYHPLCNLLHKQGNRNFSVENYSTKKYFSASENNYSKDKKYTFDAKQWQSILDFTNILKDSASKYAYMGCIKAHLSGDSGYIPYANYRQYSHPNVHVEANDILLEGGLDDGISSLQFFNAMQNKGKIYAFEAFEQNWQNLRETLAPHKENIIFEEKALWENTGFINIDANFSSAASISSSSNAKQTPCTSIDDYCKDKEISCIKLDVEGAEPNVLKGAKNTIINNKPKLLISIYHRNFGADAVTIPQMLMDMNLDYDFYCGHHSSWCIETILYAIKK